jgi:YbbR domain-containing protein
MWEKLLDNLWLKLGAILLACLLWLHASTDKLYEYTYNYNLKMVNLSPELIPAEPLPASVQVKIYGKGKELLKLLLSKERTLKIDAQRFSAGEFELPLRKEMISVPEGLNLSVIEIASPKALMINLQKIEEKKVSIISQLRFFPQEGYFQKGKVKFAPQEIKLTGPAENVEKTSYILSREKEFQDLKKSLSGTIDLVPPPVFNVRFSPQIVDFSVEIKKGEKKLLEDLPVKLINLTPGRKALLDPRTINLEIQGEKETLDELTPERIKISLDCRNLNKGETKLSPQIELPEDVLLVRAEPDSFTIEIK